MLGQDNAGLFVPFEVKHGVDNEPFATRTLYGWCLNGPVNSSHESLKVINNFVDLSIHDRLDRLWSIDNEEIDTHARGMSREDLKVMNLWDRDCSFLAGHFEIPISWKYECKIKMNNKAVAYSRLNSIKRSLKRKCMYDVYDNEVTKLVNKGYAEHVPEDCIDDLECWYLPHHAVAKKNGSFRIVYDCANKFDGVSLNDRCLQGPNLITLFLTFFFDSVSSNMHSWPTWNRCISELRNPYGIVMHYGFYGTTLRVTLYTYE